MTKTVRAKFYVESVQHHDIPGTDQYAHIVMRPVFGTYGDGDDEANKTWSKYTPSGQLNMTITNPAAIEAFDKGKAYWIDITPVKPE